MTQGPQASAQRVSGRTQEQEMLRASVSHFVSRTADHKRAREHRNACPGYDEDVQRQIANLGWHAILIPEAHGGLGLGFTEMGIVLEELGKGLLGEPLAASVVLGGMALLHSDNEARKSVLLAKLAEGKLLPCLAWQEDGGGLGAGVVATRAQASGGQVRITGRKRFVAGAGAASGFLVNARTGDDIGLYWVERDLPGVDISYEWRADGTPSAVLGLRDVAVEKTDLIASPATALHAVERAVDEAMVMAGAEMCGVMKATLDITLEYLRTRVQFGKPIGAFQALQHRAVDLYIQQELAAAVTAEAVKVLDRPSTDKERRMMACRAKARACEAGLRITREAVQLHGAIAIQDECNVGLYLKRALVLAAWLGNASEQRRRFMGVAAA